MKYVAPIFDSQIKFDAFVEKTRDLLKAKGPTTLEDLNKAMVTTGESPSRRIEKKEFLDVLNKFGVVCSEEDNQLLDDNLCFELSGQVDYDRFWTYLNE